MMNIDQQIEMTKARISNRGARVEELYARAITKAYERLEDMGWEDIDRFGMGDLKAEFAMIEREIREIREDDARLEVMKGIAAEIDY